MLRLIEGFSSLFSYIGALIIIYGGLLAIFKAVQLEIMKTCEFDYEVIKKDFTHKIVFGLDFLISGDILKTISTPSQQEIILLGAIVGIRTIMGFFLGKEITE